MFWTITIGFLVLGLILSALILSQPEEAPCS